MGVIGVDVDDGQRHHEDPEHLKDPEGQELAKVLPHAIKPAVRFKPNNAIEEE